MKYFKNQKGEVYAFESDGSQDEFITDDFTAMTEDEIKQHTTVKPTEYHTIWDAVNGEWLDSRTPEQITEHKRTLLPKLTKRQFALQLNSVPVGDSTMYKQVLSLIAQDDIAQIEWDTVSDIERLSPTVIMMAQNLGLTDEQVDQMWAHAMTL